jgi:hypothetical protein
VQFVKLPLPLNQREADQVLAVEVQQVKGAWNRRLLSSRMYVWCNGAATTS